MKATQTRHLVGLPASERPRARRREGRERGRARPGSAFHSLPRPRFGFVDLLILRCRCYDEILRDLTIDPHRLPQRQKNILGPFLVPVQVPVLVPRPPSPIPDRAGFSSFSLSFPLSFFFLPHFLIQLLLSLLSFSLFFFFFSLSFSYLLFFFSTDSTHTFIVSHSLSLRCDRNLVIPDRKPFFFPFFFFEVAPRRLIALLLFRPFVHTRRPFFLFFPLCPPFGNI